MTLELLKIKYIPPKYHHVVTSVKCQTHLNSTTDIYGIVVHVRDIGYIYYDTKYNKSKAGIKKAIRKDLKAMDPSRYCGEDSLINKEWPKV